MPRQRAAGGGCQPGYLEWLAGSMNGLDLLGPDQRGLYIGGSWREAEGGGRQVVIDPADGSVLTDVADGSVHDAVDALDAAV